MEVPKLSKEDIIKHFGPLPKCKHGMIMNLCDICIELDKLRASN